MKKNDKDTKTEMVFILDRSGSMSGLESDTIDGFNGMLKQQKGKAGKATVTTVLFDDRCELLHDRIDICAIRPITAREYHVRGCTALLDALGSTIDKIANVQRSVAAEHRADKVLFVITTDGMENASREYSYPRVKAMVERAKEEYGWEFLFLGANMDAVAAAGRFGIGADRAVTCHADSEGTRLNYQVISETVSCMRESRPIAPGWKEKIEQDFSRRKARR